MDDESLGEGDFLKRRHDYEFLKGFLTNSVKLRKEAGKTGSFVLNVNSSWGGGKTFFLQRMAQALREDGYYVAEIDAWSTDHSDDPLIPVISAINQTFNTEAQKSSKLRSALSKLKSNLVPILFSGLKGATITWLKWAAGEGFDNVAEALSGSDDVEAVEAGQNTSSTKSAPADKKSLSKKIQEQSTNEVAKQLESSAEKRIAKFVEADQAIKSFKTNLASVVATAAELERCTPPLFVLVDELDRCRPTYAISMLEQIKHLFEVENVVFVLATDTTQLSHSIKAVYGQGFDSSRYLQRFFDRTYQLPSPNRREFVASMLDGMPHGPDQMACLLDNPAEAIGGMIEAFDLTPRDVIHCLEALRDFVKSLPEGSPLINLYLAFTLIIAHRRHVDVSDYSTAVPNFIYEHCSSSHQIPKAASFNLQGNHVPVSMVDFLKSNFHYSSATSVQIEQTLSARIDSDSLLWTLRTERDIRQLAIDQKHNTRHYWERVLVCGNFWPQTIEP